MVDVGLGVEFPHLPVLYREILIGIRPKSPGLFVDGTVGAGGHAWGILESSKPEGRLLGLDLDPTALALARKRLSPFGDRVILKQVSYGTLQRQIESEGWSKVDGILLDLGLSSMQMDTPERGFSFQTDGPLDMRFDPENPIKAADLVNHLPEEEIANLIWRYGEERNSRIIAKEIIKARPIITTRQLADVITRASRKRDRHIHPATRTFQALRISVNKELQTLEQALPQALAALSPGGRLAVISFHSLEDRIVKQFFRIESRDCICPPERPVCTCEHHASMIEITRHPITAGDAEVQNNPRARSARLRIAEKIDLA